MLKANKERTIYIRLLEGTETLVPVTAISLDDNLFKIKENKYLDLKEDISSIWEFFPTDVVKCTKRDGNFVAFELVESTFSDRKIYQLIFLIVKSLGEITHSRLRGFESEIQRLCKDKEIPQREHPIIKEWLVRNCG